MAANRPLDPSTLDRLNAWVRTAGVDAVAARLGTSVATVNRINAGARCNPLTARAVELALAAQDSADSRAESEVA